MSGAEGGLLPHLKELQQRLRWALVVYALGVVVLMNASDEVFRLMTRPLMDALPAGTPMVFLGAPDVFFTYLKVALLASLFATSPFTFYQLWAFVAPGLYRHERRIFLIGFAASVVLFIAGGAFAYFVVFPLAFKFFLGFATDQIHALPAVREYLSLFLKLLFAFGLSFEIPLVMVVLARLGVVDPENLAGKRRHVVVWAFILAAVLTPPDVISQVMLALPMLLLFELGLGLARRQKREASAPSS
ncbi:MAG: twin-arginine translocase subunit TatC [Deltaproteobacteria bacterium]|nr:MAG: twin-arginine translocase subunit TatC [Deltaproteobacteria bacterium]